MEGSIHGLIWEPILASAWRDWGKPQNLSHDSWYLGWDLNALEPPKYKARMLTTRLLHSMGFILPANTYEFCTVFIVSECTYNIILIFSTIHFLLFSEWLFSGFELLCYAVPHNLVSKVSCAGRLSSIWYGNIVQPQCMLCINWLRASCWFDCIQRL
jgi:hypothetical protein